MSPFFAFIHLLQTKIDWQKKKITYICKGSLPSKTVHTYFQKSVGGIQGEELFEFYTRRHLILLAELQEVLSGSRVIVGCPQFAPSQTLEPSIQVLHVRVKIFS